MVEDIVRNFGFLTLGSRMKRIGERLQAGAQIVADEGGGGVLTSQYPFLAALDRMGPLTIGEIAEAVGIAQPGATRSVAQLVRQGLVVVRRGARDQRRREVSLTKKGAAEVTLGQREIWPRIEAAVANLCRALDGPLLAQLAHMEDGLAETPLNRRIPERRGSGAGGKARRRR